MSKFLSNLSEEQKRVVIHNQKNQNPILIRAGAGAGKTKTLVNRIGYLIDNNEAIPSDFCVLSFSNKSANEIKRRIKDSMDQDLSQLMCGTFHSISLKLLRTYFNFEKNVCDSDDSDGIIKKLYKSEITRIKEFLETTKMSDEEKEAFIEALINTRTIREIIGKAKNTGNTIYRTIDVFMENGGDIHILTGERDVETDYNDSIMNEVLYRGYMDNTSGIGVEKINRKIILKIARGYEEKKNSMNLVDFDDLLIMIVKKLRTNENIRESLDRLFKRFIVDEFQDVNYIQFEFLRLLNIEYNYLTVVGDSDQAIYSFRGCDKRYFDDFSETYDNVSQFILTHNYRSKQIIVELANSSISNNKNRFNRVMRSVSADKGDCKIIYSKDFYDEERKIMDIIKNIPLDKYSETCFLARNNRHSKRYQAMLVKNRIPFIVYGGQGFFEKKSVKDMLSILRIINNPKDYSSLQRILLLLPKVGEKSVEKFINGFEENLDLEALVLSIMSEKKFYTVGYLLQEFIEKKISVPLLLKKFYDEFYEKFMFDETDDGEINEKIDDVDNLLSLIQYIDDKDNFNGIKNFLDSVALEEEKGHKDKEGKVVLSTIHKSKGLEWDDVFMTFCFEDIFPSKRIFSSKEAYNRYIEEERNVFYVGITRARNNLYILLPKVIKEYGQDKPVSSSLFVNEII